MHNTEQDSHTIHREFEFMGLFLAPVGACTAPPIFAEYGGVKSYNRLSESGNQYKIQFSESRLYL